MSGALQQITTPVPLGMGGTGSIVGPKFASSTIAGLPAAAASAGQVFIVTDALVPALGGIVAAGGAVKVSVWSDGSNWLVI
jgi:hypothetical protein